MKGQKDLFQRCFGEGNIKKIKSQMRISKIKPKKPISIRFVN